jgi:hypothetical protein
MAPPVYFQNSTNQIYHLTKTVYHDMFVVVPQCFGGGYLAQNVVIFDCFLLEQKTKQFK